MGAKSIKENNKDKNENIITIHTFHAMVVITQ